MTGPLQTLTPAHWCPVGLGPSLLTFLPSILKRHKEVPTTTLVPSRVSERVPVPVPMIQVHRPCPCRAGHSHTPGPDHGGNEGPGRLLRTLDVVTPLLYNPSSLGASEGLDETLNDSLTGWGRSGRDPKSRTLTLGGKKVEERTGRGREEGEGSTTVLLDRLEVLLTGSYVGDLSLDPLLVVSPSGAWVLKVNQEQ